MIKRSNIRRQTVELRPSRIRREPPAIHVPDRQLRIHSEERDLWTVAIGVVLFAVTFAIIAFALSDFTSH